MRKHYILSWGLSIGLFLFVLTPFAQLSAQPMPAFLPYTHTPQYSWEGPFESYQYQSPNLANTYNMRFRLLKPNGWASSGPNDKFPMIVFLHGSGEGAPGNPTLQNNSKQLLHGGQTHMNAVLNNTFPGFLLYPQMRRTGPDCKPEDNYANCPFNNWNREWRESVRYIIDKLILDYKVDPNRIYIHGLSGGGEGVWQFITDYPEYFAAAHPMSAAGDEFHTTSASGYKEYYKHIPLRLSQGGIDSNPTPVQGNALVNGVRSVGGSIRYDYYPTLGHGTWNSEYAKPDFFSWLLSKKKNLIHVFDEQPLACPGDPVNVRIGFSKTIYPSGRDGVSWLGGAGGNRYAITNYEWARDNTSNVVASGAAVNELVVTTAGPYTPGTYYGRYQRVDGTWSAWSDPVVIADTRGPSSTPTISSNGKSTTLPALDGSGEVLLSGPAGRAAYQWKKDATNIAGATIFDYTASQAGFYTLVSKDAAGSPVQDDGITPTEFRAATIGCFSLPSNQIRITTSNGLGVPAPPGNFFVAATSGTSITVTWDDRSNNETAFEVYRSITSGSGYALAALLPASSSGNPQTYLDNGLQPNTTYFYRMRAVNGEGGSAYTPVASATTTVDVTPPSSPVLTVTGTLRNTILLEWSGATDLVGVTGYDVYQNGSLVGSVTTQYFLATNVVALSTYSFTVKAKDASGNISPFSNQVSAVARNNGLLYHYYHHNNLNSTADIPSGTLMKVGFVSAPSTSPKTQLDKHAFVYEGFINIPSSGNHVFSTQTDEGSRLWVNNVLVVDNDGIQSCTKVNSASINLSTGWYPFRLEYFENGGTECFTIRWTRPGQNETTIPSSAFTESVTNPPAITNPSNFTAPAATIAYNQVVLTWNDNSNNETGFEIYRLKSPDGAGTYQVVNTTAANTTTWTDNTVLASTRYYYRIRAINAVSASSTINLTGTFITTPAPPTPPPAPATLIATAISATQIDVTWANVTGETGFEVQKSSSSTTGFSTIATVGVNITTYSDTDASGHSTYYYRVRSLGVGGATSAWSPVASASTPNRNPVFTAIPDQTLQQSSPTAQTINISVTDPDNDPINFTFVGLPGSPAITSFISNSYGQGTLSLTNVPAGTYNITVQASDGTASVNDDFVLTVGTNQAPYISALLLDGVAVTPTPITVVQNQSMEAGRTFTMVFTLIDPNNNNQLTAAFPPILTLPPSLTFANNPAPVWNATTRQYTLVFKPTVSQAGLYDNISIQFRDNAGGINLQTFSLIVNPVDPSFSIRINFVGNSTITNPNYNEGAYYETAPWNNSGPPPTASSNFSTFVDVLSNMKDDLGTTVKFVKFQSQQGQWVGPPNNSDYNYAIDFPVDPNAVYTPKVRSSFWRTQTGAGGGQNRSIRFTNLNPALKYKVTLYGAYPQATARTTRYLVTGSGPGEQLNLVTTNNTNQVVTSTEAYPDASGQLTINIAGTGGGQGNYQIFINSVILEANYVENAPPAAPSNVALEAPAYNQVKVTWQDNSLNESGFRIYRATVAGGPYTQVGSVGAGIKLFTDGTTSGRTTYYYKVSAWNAFGESAMSNYALITTPNGVPVLANPGSITMTTGQVLQVNISATDPENDPMTFSVPGLPSFATLVDNGNGTGFIRFTPTVADAGLYQINLSVMDNYSASADVTFPVTIGNAEVLETVYVNFNASSSSNAPLPWNNLTTTGPLTGTTMTLTRNGTWLTPSDNVGVNTNSNSGLYADKVIQSGWISAQTSTTGSYIQLGNLNNNYRYNITILGSRDEFWFANTIYQITQGTPNGAATDKVLNTRKNKSNVVRYTGIAPSSTAIRVSVRKDATVESAAGGSYILVNHRDAVISGMVIEVYDPNNPSGKPPRTPTNFVATPLSKTSIRLTWNDNSSNETGFEIQRADDPTGTFTTITTTAASIETYDNINLPNNKAYVYRVRAVKTSVPASQSPWSNTAIASTYKQIILVNVNGAASEGVPQETSGPWYNTNMGSGNLKGADGFMWSNLTDNTSTPSTPFVTPVDLRLFYYGNGGDRPNRGYVGGAEAIYPANVLLPAYLFLPGDPPSEWELQDLDPSAAYDIAFFSSEWEMARRPEGGKIVTDFSIGAAKQSLFNAKNNTQRVFFNSIRPEADSTIHFQVNAHNSATEVIYNGMWSAFEIRSYTPLEAAFDQTPPSIPQNLVATNIGRDSVRLTWSPSTDNIRVAGYEVFQGSTLVTTIAGTTVKITGLQPATTYTFSVRARDEKGNLSGFSNTVEVTTLSATGALTYYSKPTGSVSSLGSWALNGTGSPPATFAANNQHFFLNRNGVVDAPMNLTGVNTKLVVSAGISLTVDQTITGMVELADNASMTINSSTPPTLGTLAPTSTVIFNGQTNIIPGASYGNLVLEGSSTTKTFSAGAYTINGDMTLMSDVELNGAANNGTVLNLSGNLTIQGDVMLPADDELIVLNFISASPQTLSVPTAASLRLYEIHVSNNSQLTVAGGTTPKNIILGTPAGGGLTLEDGTSLDLGKNNLTIDGSGAINSEDERGQIKVSKGDININSIGSQISNLYFSPGADTAKAVNINANDQGQVNIGSRLYIREVIDLNSGRLNSAGNISLVSDATATARIAKIGDNGSVIGGVEFQRYMTAKRVYRYMSVPVFNSQILDWQNSGIAITGPFQGTSPTNTGNPSLYYYEANYYGNNVGEWIAYPDATSSNEAAFDVGRGYSVFQFNGTTPGKLLTTGPIQQGNYDYVNLGPGTDASSPDGWNLLGNPYAAPLEWANAGWEMNDIGGAIYIRNNFVGGYSWEVKNSIGGDPDTFDGTIAQGQSFWVKATGPDPSIRLTEDAKAPVGNATLFRTEAPVNRLTIQLKNSSTLSDKTYLHFSAESVDEIESKLDALKQYNSYFSLSSMVDNLDMAINSMSLAFCEKDIPLSIRNAAAGQYNLLFTNLGTFDFDVQAELVDNFLGTSTALQEGTNYPFSVTSNPSSSGSGRFALRLSKPAVDESIALGTLAAQGCQSAEQIVLNLPASQRGVTYSFLNSNGDVVGTALGNGATTQATINTQGLPVGISQLTMQAEFIGCVPVQLSTNATIDLTAVYQPVASELNGCSGEAASLSASGAPVGALYNWYESVDSETPIASSAQGTFVTPALSEGRSYYVSAAYNTCESQRTEIVVLVDALDKPTVVNEDGTLISSSNSGNQWFLDGNEIDGATDITFTPELPGNYTVRVSSGACQKVSDPISFTITGVERDPSESIQLFPNPTRRKFRITLPSELIPHNHEIGIMITNTMGQVLRSETPALVGNTVEVDVQEFQAGLYSVTILHAAGETQKRFVKE